MKRPGLVAWMMLSAVGCAPAGVLAPGEAGRGAAPEVVDGYIRVSPGSFRFGSPPTEQWRMAWEEPQNTVVKVPYYLKQTEVTRAEWRALMGRVRPAFEECDECPVSDVSWWEAVAYCNAASALAGLEACYTMRGCVGAPMADRLAGEVEYACEAAELVDGCSGFRLPTAVEWEYAARAGSNEARYGPLDAIAWHEGNADGRAQPVATRAPNAWGFHDMIGNVSEWVEDPIDELGARHRVFYTEGPDDRREVRGGSFGEQASSLRAASRSGLGRYRTYMTLGFRPARSAPTTATRTPRF